MNICLDTSLLIKLLTHEPESNRVSHLFQQWLSRDDQLLTPHFTRYEIYSVLRKKNFLKEITEEQMDQALKDFQALPVEYVEEVALLPKVLSWSKKLKQAVIYDCLYVGVAEARDAILWTCDEKFYKACKGEFSKIECLSSEK